MNILFEKYGITEADFISSELEAVPAFKAKDVGFDRSMIGAYGHDDKVCAYTALMATVDCNNPVHTVVTVLTDKEETGSDGNTGLCSASYLILPKLSAQTAERYSLHPSVFPQTLTPHLTRLSQKSTKKITVPI